MAISLSNVGLFLTKPVALHSETNSPVPFPIRKPQFRISTVPPCRLTKTSNSISPIATELEKPKGEDRYEETETETTTRLAEVWRSIHGGEDWEGLLEPMDPLLRAELIRYGEMAQACYDAFDFDLFSKYCGSCKFSVPRFFESLAMPEVGYDVTRFLYATSNINLPNFFKKSRWPKVWSKHANWIGYVAVSDDEQTKRLGRRDIVVAWRGTVTRLEWIADLKVFLKPVSISLDRIPCPDTTVKAESGFLDLYTEKEEKCHSHHCKYSAREQILGEIKRLVEIYGDEEELSITITGHSLGSALAILSAYDIREMGVDVTKDGRVVPVCVFSFSGPRVGNGSFRDRLHSLGVKVLRVVNVHDVVPRSPGWIFSEQAPPLIEKLAEDLPWDYSHVGVELQLDHRNSPFLKETVDPVCSHDLEGLLHLVDGYHGKGKRFVLASGRDPALVNKASDFLNDDFLVPPHWKQDQNKGMVRNGDGRWVQPERPMLDDHTADLHLYLTKLGLASDK